MANTIFTQKSTCLAVGTFIRRCQASKLDHPIHNHHHLRFNSESCFSVVEQNLGLRFQNTRKMNMVVVYSSIPSEAPLPADPSPAHWNVGSWIIGAIITILMSFSRGKWGPLLQLKDKIETTIDEAEKVVDIVEEVAERVEEVAEGVVKHLPEGKLHDAVEFVEKVAEDIDKLAENAEDALEKLEDMEKELESSFESTTRQEKNTVPTAEAKDQS